MNMNLFNFKAPQLVFTGLLLRVNRKEARIDKKTGEEFPQKAELQLFCNMVQRDDSIRSEMVNLSLKDDTQFSAYESLIGQIVRVPVGYMNTERGGVIFWAMKGYAPEIVHHTEEPKQTNTPTPSSAVKSPLGGA